MLDPDVLLVADGGETRPFVSAVVRGAAEVAGRAITFSQPGASLRPAIVNGVAGVVVFVDEQLFSVMAFTVAGGKVAAIDVLADPERLARLDLSAVDVP